MRYISRRQTDSNKREMSKRYKSGYKSTRGYSSSRQSITSVAEKRAVEDTATNETAKEHKAAHEIAANKTVSGNIEAEDRAAHETAVYKTAAGDTAKRQQKNIACDSAHLHRQNAANIANIICCSNINKKAKVNQKLGKTDETLERKQN